MNIMPALFLMCLISGVAETEVKAPTDFAILTDGDPIRGKALYAQCLACHSPERNRTGPKHCGLVTRKAGTAPGYEYSNAMQQVNIVWNAQTLDEFLYSPLTFIPGTKMGIAGIKNEGGRQDLIAYLIAMNGQDECN